MSSKTPDTEDIVRSERILKELSRLLNITPKELIGILKAGERIVLDQKSLRFLQVLSEIENLYY